MDDGITPMGIIGGFFRVKDIMRQAVQVSCDISMFDFSDNMNYLYTTNAAWRQISPGTDSKSPASEEALLSLLEQMESRGEIPPRFNVTVGDRTWVAFLSANQQFQASIGLDTVGKWVALALCLFFGFVALLASWAVIIIKRLLYTATVNGLMSHKIVELRKTQEKMDGLIERLGQEEQRVRGTMNLVPLSILIVDANNGTISYANEQFVQGFSYPFSEVQSKQVTLGQVFPVVDMSALTSARKEVSGQSLVNIGRIIIRTTVRSKLGAEKTRRVCISYHNSKTEFTKSQGKGVGLWRRNLLRDDCFVVIIFDGQLDSLTMANNNSRSNEDRSESTANTLNDDIQESRAFYRMLYEQEEKGRLEEFRAFCKNEHSEEGLLFFDAVEKYRRTDRFMARVQLQAEIVEDFLEPGAPHQLNLSHEKLTNKMSALRECLGQADVFDELLEYVLTDIRLDIFGRFYRSKQQQPRTKTSAADTQQCTATVAELDDVELDRIESAAIATASAEMQQQQERVEPGDV